MRKTRGLQRPFPACTPVPKQHPQRRAHQGCGKTGTTGRSGRFVTYHPSHSGPIPRPTQEDPWPKDKCTTTRWQKSRRKTHHHPKRATALTAPLHRRQQCSRAARTRTNRRRLCLLLVKKLLTSAERGVMPFHLSHEHPFCRYQRRLLTPMAHRTTP